MMEFIKNYWSEILSILGASAWLPVVIIPLINHFSKIQATILDAHILVDGHSRAAYKDEEKIGTYLLLALNLFSSKLTLFARKIVVKVRLKNGAYLNAELSDFSSITSYNKDGSKNTFEVPIGQEFNVSRTIHQGVDNIKYIALLVENANFQYVQDISEIEIKIYFTSKCRELFSKKITLYLSDFPTHNPSHMIRRVVRYI